MNDPRLESRLLPNTQKPIELKPLAKNGNSKSHDKLTVEMPQLPSSSEDDVVIGRFRKISSAKSMAITNGNLKYPGDVPSPATENGDDTEAGLVFRPLEEQINRKERFADDESANMLPPSSPTPRQNKTKITKSSFRDVEKPSRFRGTSSATRFQTDDLGMTTSEDDDAADSVGEGSDDPLTAHNTDTKYGKSFRQMTREALPRLDNYRNIMSLHAAARPTLDELHNASLGPKSGVQGGRVAGPDAGSGAGADTGVKFGWVQGVLVRCLLNIWGVMLFLRLSWVVAQAGIGQAVLLILTTSAVTTITALSMSAISTNGVIKGGGTYYMISRSLGPEFGGSIGLIFSMANAVACAMYVVGFCESLMDLLRSFGSSIVDGGIQDVRIIGTITIVILTVIVVVGMEWEAKAQLALLFILLVAILDFILGSIIGPKSDLDVARGFLGYNSTIFEHNLLPDYRLKEGIHHNFFSVFAIFFPAATGILAGANISGDLRDPQTSIPKGTLLAIFFTTLSYVVMAIIAGGTVVRQATGDLADLANGTYLDCMNRNCSYGLHNSFQVIELVSGFGPLIYAGCFAATLSSALASLVSAPKVFQALCKDKLYPGIEWFARGYGKNNEPVRGYILTFFIAVAFILIGELNTIAPLISNFFLAAYTLINFSTFHASLVKPVGWRPTFRFYNMWLSLFGSVLCVAVMFLISWWTALLTFSVVLALYLIVSYRKPDVNWGSTTQAQIYNTALAGVHQLNAVTDHVKNYRPQVLVMTGNPSRRPALVHFTNLIAKGHSLMICGHVVQGTMNNRTRAALTNSSREWLQKHKVKAFYGVVDSDIGSFGKGADALIQSSGLGKLKPNILLMGFKSDWNSCPANELAEYVDVMHKALDVHMGLAILRLEGGIEIPSKDFHGNILEGHGLTKIGDLLDNSLQNATKYNESNESLANTTGAAQISQASSVSDMSVTGSSPTGNATGAQSVSADPAAANKTDGLEENSKRTLMGTRTRKRGGSSSTREPLTIFQRKHTGTIDVWWLYDDGGLTLLLPYLVSMRRTWSSCRLRVFTLANKRTELEFEQRNMASLLSKFRIDYSDLKVIPDITKPPSEATQAYFSRLLNSLGVSSADELAGRERSLRHLRLRELIREHSWGAELLVMTLPMPRRAQVTPAALYMSWLEALTGGPAAPPCLLVRGNHTSVLTFYS